MSGMVNVGLSPAGPPMMGGHASPYGFHGRSPNPHMVPHGGGPPPPHPAMMAGGHHPHAMMQGGPHMGSPMHSHLQMPHHSPASNPMIQQQQSSQQQQQQQQQQQGQQAAQAAGGGDKEVTQVSSMPLPPNQYIDQYTDEAVARGMAPQPPPPITDSYSMFGNPFSAEDKIIQSLESQGIRRLYSSKDVDRKKELHKLNQSILVNFLDLLDILIRAPESPKREEKIEDINLLFIHMHHLVNEFRPHQARETLRVMLQVQMRKRLQIADRFQKHLDEVQETIEKALRSLPEPEETMDIDKQRKELTANIENTAESSAKVVAFDPVDSSVSQSLDEFIMNS